MMSPEPPIKGLVALGAEGGLFVRDPLSGSLRRHVHCLHLRKFGFFRKAFVYASMQVLLGVSLSQEGFSGLVVEIFDRKLLSLVGLGRLNSLLAQQG